MDGHQNAKARKTNRMYIPVNMESSLLYTRGNFVLLLFQFFLFLSFVCVFLVFCFFLHALDAPTLLLVSTETKFIAS